MNGTGAGRKGITGAQGTAKGLSYGLHSRLLYRIAMKVAEPLPRNAPKKAGRGRVGRWKASRFSNDEVGVMLVLYALGIRPKTITQMFRCSYGTLRNFVTGNNRQNVYREAA